MNNCPSCDQRRVVRGIAQSHIAVGRYAHTVFSISAVGACIRTVGPSRAVRAVVSHAANEIPISFETSCMLRQERLTLC